MSNRAWNPSPNSFTAVLGAEAKAPSARLAFSASYRSLGLLMTLGALALLGTGFFLLSQISSTPKVAAQVCVVGLLLTAVGLGVQFRAFQRIFGVLSIDEGGVALRPELGGFALTWNEMAAWEVRDARFPIRGVPKVRFWFEGQPAPLNVPADALAEEAVETTRRLLREYAPEKDRNRAEPNRLLTR